ncbi:nickel transporter subunit; membrane component of ABC superfamily [Mesorhizobium metallidurans STM 2683]|uniref:Nickel transporter subunit membrane component of ABC superfamily n=1 Tax=Mesorhizobium metallidurans STM 2683 TaxID=1297569 RepID=M5ET60_9HYPH|nr:ABC transporter permease [Mesorhizobium metallidurans]CCV07442.1 nickel transporter subunit; membrane component of ABC superfamily [Mesorhizobium metallidurans STM 2683]
MKRLLHSIGEAFSSFPKAALIGVGLFLFLGAFGPWLVPHDPNFQDLTARFAGPSADHWLGTDHVGRDVFSRLIVSARTTVVAMTIIVTFKLLIGVTLGTFAGFVKGRTEEILMRFVELFMALPSLIIALAVIGVLGIGYWNMVLALILAFWAGSTRVARGVAIGILNLPHIEALRVLGASPLRIYFRHLLPSTLGMVLVYVSADAGGIALSIATLSFLGLGIQPPTPEWGQMLVDALPYLDLNPWMVLLPGFAITGVVVSFNLLGEAIALNRVPRELRRSVLRRGRLVAASWERASSEDPNKRIAT